MALRVGCSLGLFLCLHVLLMPEKSLAYPQLFEDADSIVDAYEDVLDDSTPTEWLILHYEGGGKKVSLYRTGVNYDDMLALLPVDERMYCFVRFDLDDGVTKFALITWIGGGVTPLKKARVSTDKAFVKEIFPKYSGRETLADVKADLQRQKVIDYCFARHQ